MHKKDFILGLSVGMIAGVITGILFAPKSGKETRQDIKNYLGEIKDRVAEEVTKAGRLTREKFSTIVDSIVDSYRDTKKITEEDADEIKQDLKENYSKIRDAMEK